MISNFYALKLRIMLAFALCTLLIALIFGGGSFILAYHIEDVFFTSELKQAAIQLTSQLNANKTPHVIPPYISYYPSFSELPEMIKVASDNDVTNNEVALDDGRHFHLLKFDQGYLLANVTDHLVVRSIRPTMFIFLGTLFTFTMLLAFGMAFVISRYLLIPLKKLTTIAQHTPSNTLPKGWSKAFGKNEIGQMAIELEKAWDRSAAFLKREQLFTRDVSHELRTPLTVNNGALTLLASEGLSERQKELANRLIASQTQMTQMLDSLFDLARESPVKPGTSYVLPIVENSILQQHHLLHNKDVTLHVNVKLGDKVPVNSAALSSIIDNLISNAIKNTESGTITIEYHPHCLTISDTGVGIADELSNSIFDAGVKDEASKGLGMGLSIVQRLCERWNIECKIQSVENGTTVSLSFCSCMLDES